jgi:hypothetical protein
VWSLLLLVRNREPRVGLLTLLFALLLGIEAVALESQWGTPIAANAATAGAFGALGVAVLGLLVLGALADMAVERDLVEALHWDSMQAVRALAEIGANDQLDLDQRLSALLEMGRASFGLQVGVLCRANEDEMEVIAISSADAFPVAAGSALGSYCKDAMAADRPIAIARMNGVVQAAHPAASAFGFQAYMATAIRVDGELYGTLGFGGLEPRSERFTATDKDLLSLMGQWVASEIERRRKSGQEEPEPATPNAITPWRKRLRGPRGTDLNATVRRLERRLVRMAGAKVDIVLALSPDLEAAQVHGIPIEKVVRSLVANALDAMPDGGSLELRTENLEITAQPGAAMSAAAPDRYVTLSVRDTGKAIDADSLSRVFEPDANGSLATEEGSSDERLHLSTVYRILHRSGGDLSVSVEPEGTTLTIFLRRFEAPEVQSEPLPEPREQVKAPRPAPVAAPPPGPPPYPTTV